MSTTKNLLVELQVEELPPKALKKLGEAFGAELVAGLRPARLLTETSVLTTFATPRRLAAHVTQVAAATPPEARREKLVPANVGIGKDGGKTPALQKKLEALGAGATELGALERSSDGKQEMLYLAFIAPARPLAGELQAALDRALSKLPIPKVMSYQLADGWSNVHFVRPAHALVALHGAEVVPVNALGLQAGRETVGHRFEAKASPLAIRDADSYAQQLADEGAVIASFAERRAEITRQLQAAAASAGLKPIDDDALLDEVTALVERPNVLCCQFEPEYLDVPQECLILTMKANQKYFPLLDAAGKLTNRFLIVSNIRPADPRAVIEGNERVVRPRLADAKFFFDQDRRSTLESRVDGLRSVVYHAKLGSQLDRVERLTSIAVEIARELQADVTHVERAARLAKADLRTLMVGEFPELQGVMGTYYARHDGEAADVAAAIEEHYRPRFAGDALPTSRVGICVALADKLETLAGLFSVGERPTGEKDPYALRRHALGVIRILIDSALPVSLLRLVGSACARFESDVQTDVVFFIHDRLRVLLKDRGWTAEEIEAVLAKNHIRLDVLPRLLAAVRAFGSLPEAGSLAVANKRIVNILNRSGGSNVALDPSQLSEQAEKALYVALTNLRPTVDRLFRAGDYTEALKSLAPLKLPVDEFFDDVMVNVDDERLRANRLALLADLQVLMNRVADLSLLAAG
ncbi:MAG: glycine--tRNA ligase subunit beta [Burkholderiales bacterium]|nr:glycine--tRNA ligase subunit beta [Burkholderiales bacterium]